MSYKKTLSFEIEYLKEVLEITAKKHGYNFNHPQVIAVSQKLDDLILKKMQENHSVAIH